MALQHLSLEQRLITTLHSTYIDEQIPNSAFWSIDLFHSVRHLDLHTGLQPSVFGNFFRRMAYSHNAMERLSLNACLLRDSDGELFQYMLDATAHLDIEASDSILPRLKDLSVCGFDLALPWYSVLRKVINFERLDRLHISKCYSGPMFFADLGSDPTIESLHLKHIAVDCLNEDSHGRREEGLRPAPIDSCLEEVLGKCGPLVSLHVGWYEQWIKKRETGLIRNILDKIHRHGEALRVLALCPHKANDNFEEKIDSLGVNLDLVCKACPNLEQLEYQLGPGVLVDTSNNREVDTVLDDFVVRHF